MTNLSQHNIITDLPSSLSCAVLSDWVDLKELARLDSAFCSHIKRAELLTLLQSDELVNSGGVISTSDSLEWVAIRNVKASCSNIIPRSAKMRTLWWTYLEKHGKFVRDIAVSTSTIEGMATYCENLKYLTCHFGFDNTGMFNALRTLLLCNNGITHLQVEGFGHIELDWSEGIQLTLLQSIVFNEWGFTHEQIRSFLQVAPNLMKLYLLHPDAILLASNCPHLRTLSFYDCEVSDETIYALVTSCPHIVHLQFLNCRNLTDAHVLILVAYYKLRSLRLNGCSLLTDLALDSIQQYCANTLQLLMLNNELMTHSAIENLRQACTKLDVFQWEEFYQRYVSAVDTRVTKLYCMTSLDDAVINNIADNYPSIEVISFYYSVDIYDCSTRSLHILTQGCPKLHTLFVGKTVAAFVRTLAAALPQLTVRTDRRDYLRNSVNIMLLPID